MTFACGLVLLLAYFVNATRHAPPDHLAAVAGRVTDVNETKQGVLLYLIPQGASSDSGHYFHYPHSHGSSGVVAIQLRESATRIVTLRYSEASGEVFEILVADRAIRALTETLSARRSNDRLLLGLGIALLSSAAWPMFYQVRRRLTTK